MGRWQRREKGRLEQLGAPTTLKQQHEVSTYFRNYRNRSLANLRAYKYIGNYKNRSPANLRAYVQVYHSCSHSQGKSVGSTRL